MLTRCGGRVQFGLSWYDPQEAFAFQLPDGTVGFRSRHLTEVTYLAGLLGPHPDQSKVDSGLIFGQSQTPESTNLSIFDSQANPQPVLAYAMGVCESVIGIMALSLIIVLEDLAPNSVARVR